MRSTQHEQYRHREAGRRLRFALSASVIFTAVLWWIRLIESLGGWNFNVLGVEPRVPSGLVGVVLAPLLHVSWAHLLANTAPVLILGTALLYGYPKASRITIPAIWLGSGLGVWFTGPLAYHLGASGLVMGFIVFLLVAGVLRRDRTSAAITCAVAFLYGSALVAIVPHADTHIHISYSMHAWGAGIGLVCALTLFRLDPVPPRKRYSWETEPGDEDDPLIGDLWRYPPSDPPPAPPPEEPTPRYAKPPRHSVEGPFDKPPRLH